MTNTRPRLLIRFLPVVLLAAALPASAAQAWWVQREPGVREVRVEGPQGRRVMVSSLGRGFLGVGLLNITDELRQFYGAPADAGVLVSRVEEDSPAAAAGLAVGDIITEVDGHAVERPFDVIRGVGRLAPEDTVELGVVRAGAPLTLTATLGEREGGVWFSGDFEMPEFERLSELGEELPRIMLDTEETRRTVREAMEAAREQLRGLDVEDLTARLAEAEERLAELEKKLAERER